MKPNAEAFEDGTPSFLAAPSVCDGLNWLTRIGIPHVARHTACLTRKLLNGLKALDNRVALYGPGSDVDRGGTVAFNLRRRNEVLPYELVEAAAREQGIAIRGGCFCNPGAAEHAFRTPGELARECLRGEFSVPRLRACLENRAVGAIRASVGVATTEDDVQRLLALVDELTRIDTAVCA